MEIFALVTGVLFLLFEIRQNNMMWLLQAISGAASVIVFCNQGLYASMGLNIYYVVVALFGYISWKKDEAKSGGESIHLRRLTLPVVLWSVIALAAGTAVFIWILRLLGDSMSGMDAFVTVLSVIATWWLARSYKEQWLLWILADIFYVVMCALQGMWWMTVLYVFYTISAALEVRGRLCRVTSPSYIPAITSIMNSNVPARISVSRTIIPGQMPRQASRTEGTASVISIVVTGNDRRLAMRKFMGNVRK